MGLNICLYKHLDVDDPPYVYNGYGISAHEFYTPMFEEMPEEVWDSCRYGHDRSFVALVECEFYQESDFFRITNVAEVRAWVYTLQQEEQPRFLNLLKLLEEDETLFLWIC